MADKALLERHASYIEMYWEYFKEDYPLMMYEEGPSESISRMKECISKGKRVQDLYPLKLKKDVVI